MDAAFSALCRALHDLPKPLLVLLDDGCPRSGWPQPLAGVQLLVNRYDVYLALQHAGWAVEFSDWQLDSYPSAHYASVLYQVAKEKPAVLHLLEHSARLLAPDGQLCLLGYNEQGIQSYIRKASARLGRLAEQQLLGKGLRQAWITRLAAHTSAALTTQDYTQLQLIGEQQELRFYSKPGVFGWDKLDAGSRLLIASLEAQQPSLSGARVLDLGCGYGYLSAHAARLGAAAMVATDNNAAALLASQRTLAPWAERVQIVADDCAQAISQRFDYVLCNPPFHQGFKVESQLTHRFLHATEQHLAPNGQAWWVVNRFIPVERLASGVFRQCCLVADDGRFKVFQLGNARPVKPPRS